MLFFPQLYSAVHGNQVLNASFTEVVFVEIINSHLLPFEERKETSEYGVYRVFRSLSVPFSNILDDERELNNAKMLDSFRNSAQSKIGG